MNNREKLKNFEEFLSAPGSFYGTGLWLRNIGKIIVTPTLADAPPEDADDRRAPATRSLAENLARPGYCSNC